MIREFALDPDLLANWQNFRYFMDGFGISKGRLIAKFPGKWEKAVYASIRRSNCGDLEKARLEEKLRRIDKRIFRLRDCSGWSNAIDWFHNCLAEHEKNPFSAIIANNPEAENCAVFDGLTLDSESPPWKTDNSKIISRDADEMARCLKLFLQGSTRLVFVDQYFDPDKLRFRKSLLKFIETALDAPIKKLSEVYFHIGNELFTENYFETRARSKLSAVIPQGVSVRFIQWGQNQLHNRYILSDIGAVMFGHGLDECDNSEMQTDTVALLSESDRLELLGFFDKGKPFCEILGQKEIQ